MSITSFRAIRAIRVKNPKIRTHPSDPYPIRG